MSDKETALINKAAEKIVESGFEVGAMFILSALKPVFFIGGELGHFFMAPYLVLLEGKGEEFLDTFEKRENIEKLITRVGELSEEKHIEKVEAKRIRDEKVININVLIKNAIQRIFGKKI